MKDGHAMRLEICHSDVVNNKQDRWYLKRPVCQSDILNCPVSLVLLILSGRENLAGKRFPKLQGAKK
jgi:hypothetical protein